MICLAVTMRNQKESSRNISSFKRWITNIRPQAKKETEMKHIYGYVPKSHINIDQDQEEFHMSMNSYIRRYMGEEYDPKKHQFDQGPCVTIGALNCPKCDKKHRWSMHLNISTGEVTGDIPECCGLQLLDLVQMKKKPLNLENFRDIFGDTVK
jgi:hypothetical protein